MLREVAVEATESRLLQPVEATESRLLHPLEAIGRQFASPGAWSVGQEEDTGRLREVAVVTIRKRRIVGRRSTARHLRSTHRDRRSTAARGTIPLVRRSGAAVAEARVRVMAVCRCEATAMCSSETSRRDTRNEAHCRLQPVQATDSRLLHRAAAAVRSMIAVGRSTAAAAATAVVMAAVDVAGDRFLEVPEAAGTRRMQLLSPGSDSAGECGLLDGWSPLGSMDNDGSSDCGKHMHRSGHRTEWSKIMVISTCGMEPPLAISRRMLQRRLCSRAMEFFTLWFSGGSEGEMGLPAHITQSKVKHEATQRATAGFWQASTGFPACSRVSTAQPLYLMPNWTLRRPRFLSNLALRQAPKSDAAFGTTAGMH
jgi:hypothetical protein